MPRLENRLRTTLRIATLSFDQRSVRAFSRTVSLLRGRCDRHGSIFRRAQVAGDAILVHRPNHEFIEHVIAPGVKLNRLAMTFLSFFSMVLSSAVTFSVYCHASRSLL